MTPFKTLARLGFIYDVEVTDKKGRVVSRDRCKNLVPTQGLNFLLDAGPGDAAQIASFYVGIFEANYVPLITDTAQNIAANSAESTAYAETVRQNFTANGPASGGSLSNSVAPAVFTMNAAKTIYGAFVSSGQAKGSTLGVLISAARFTSPQVATSGNKVTATIQINLVDG